MSFPQLFPTELESKQELVMGIRKFLQSLPRPVVIVMRYLFAFLNQYVLAKANTQ